jgi:hypothetical protein
MKEPRTKPLTAVIAELREVLIKSSERRGDHDTAALVRRLFAPPDDSEAEPGKKDAA